MSGEKRRCDARTTEWDCGAKRLQGDPTLRLEIDRIKDADDDAGVDTVLSPMKLSRETGDGDIRDCDSTRWTARGEEKRVRVE